jgi:hypothetical protein
MSNQPKHSPLTTLFIVVVLGVTALTLAYLVVVFFIPDNPFNPLSPQRATWVAETRIANIPTPTPLPAPTSDQAYPPTWTPTVTSTPAPTKTPTQTRTPTPTKTPSPSNTPTATRTFTPLPPTDTPTVTSTPTPYPFALMSHASENNCANMGLRGVVVGPEGLPAAGINIQYGELGVPGSQFVTTTDANGRYVALLLPGSNPGAYQSHNWYAYVINTNGVRLSQEFRFTTDPLYADNPSYCNADDDDDDEDAGDDEDTDDDEDTNDDEDASDDEESNDDDNDTNPDDELEPGCLLDPCQSTHSVQVKVINWRFVPFGAY